MTESRIKGRLLFYTEQGMEGGYLSFQDESLIKLINVDSVYGFGENRKVWDPTNTNRSGMDLLPLSGHKVKDKLIP